MVLVVRPWKGRTTKGNYVVLALDGMNVIICGKSHPPKTEVLTAITTPTEILFYRVAKPLHFVLSSVSKDGLAASREGLPTR